MSNSVCVTISGEAAVRTAALHRITAALADAGFEVTSIDVDGQMLDPGLALGIFVDDRPAASVMATEAVAFTAIQDGAAVPRTVTGMMGPMRRHFGSLSEIGEAIKGTDA